MIHTNVSNHPDRRAAQVISKALELRVEQPTLLLLAGGSALRVLDLIDPDTLGPHLTITMMDERYSADPKINNFIQMQQTRFHAEARQHEVRILPSIPNSEESHDAFAARMAGQLATVVTDVARPYGIALFGIGPDGHTAAIFPMDAGPFTETYTNIPTTMTAVTYSNNPFPQRVSITPDFIRTYLDETFVYATGAEKRPVLVQLDEKLPLNKLPAHIHSEIGSTLFTDQLYTA